MSPVLLTSFLILAAAVGWSFVLLQRLRDWRLGFVIGSLVATIVWLVGMVARLAMVVEREVGVTGHRIASGPGELQQLAISGLGMAAVIYFHVVFQRDSVTGLPNRARFMHALRRALRRFHQGTDSAFAVMLLDLDRFTVINHSIGHKLADRLLAAVAGRLQSFLRDGDMLARLGSDEFVFLSYGLNATTVADAAEQIQQELSRPIIVAGQEMFTSACIGAAISSRGHDRADRLLREADLAIYRAKTEGTGRHELFDAAMHKDAIDSLTLEGDLRRALERQEFTVHYQPIVDLRDGRVAGFEALVRWRHPRRGLTLPDEFIPLAEETGLIIPIGKWVLEDACRQMHMWQAAYPSVRDVVMHVNLSGRQFMQDDLVEDIQRILGRTRLNARSLGLEITESVVMDDVDVAIATLSRLRALDVKLQIDDFGTGYSSLSYLSRFPIDTLKIDRSFVVGMEEEEGNMKIVRSIVALARDMQLAVIAEGVQSVDQIRSLRSLGCGFGQGNFLSRALDGDAVRKLLSTGQLPHWPLPRPVRDAI